MIEEKIKELLNDTIEKEGFRIDSIKYELEGNNYFLRIILDRDKIIDIDSIVEITNIINPILDKSNILDGSYILDISSKEKGI